MSDKYEDIRTLLTVFWLLTFYLNVERIFIKSFKFLSVKGFRN